jgi:hypothetical protein
MTKFHYQYLYPTKYVVLEIKIENKFFIWLWNTLPFNVFPIYTLRIIKLFLKIPIENQVLYQLYDNVGLWTCFTKIEQLEKPHVPLMFETLFLLDVLVCLLASVSMRMKSRRNLTRVASPCMQENKCIDDSNNLYFLYIE